MFGSMHSSASADFYTTRRRIRRPNRPSNSEYPASPRIERQLVNYCDVAQDGERNQDVFNDLFRDLQCVVHKSYGKQVNEYQVKCQCLEEEMVELKDELVEVEENKFAIANELMKAAADAQTAQEAYGDETRRRCILETVVTEQKASINRLNSLLEVDTKEKDHLLNCIKDLEEQLKESQEIMDDLQKQMLDMEETCVEHKEVEETQKVEIATHEEKCCSLVEALAKCCEDNDDFQREIAKLKEQNEKMKCVLERLETDRKCIIEEFLKERKCCEQEKTRMENCILQLKNSLEDVVGQKNDVCRKMNAVVSAHHSEMDCLRKEKEKLSLLNTGLKSDLEKVKRSLKDCHRDKIELKSEIKRLQKENANQRQNLRDQENLISDLSDKLNDQSQQKEMAKRQLFKGVEGLTKMTCSEIVEKFLSDKLPLRNCDEVPGSNGQQKTRTSEQNDEETSVQNPQKTRNSSNGQKTRTSEQNDEENSVQNLQKTRNSSNGQQKTRKSEQNDEETSVQNPQKTRNSSNGENTRKSEQNDEETLTQNPQKTRNSSNYQQKTRKSEQNDEETLVQNHQNPRNKISSGNGHNFDQDRQKRNVGTNTKPKMYEEEIKTEVKVEVTTEDKQDESTLENSEKVKTRQLEQKLIRIAAEKRSLEDENQKLKKNQSQQIDKKDQNDIEYQINHLTDMNNNLKTSLAQLQKRDQTIISPEKLEKLETKVAQLQIQLDESFGEKKSLEMKLRNLGEEKTQLVQTIKNLEVEMNQNLDLKSYTSTTSAQNQTSSDKLITSQMTNLQNQLEVSQMKLRKLDEEIKSVCEINLRLEANVQKEKLAKDLIQKELDEYHQLLEKSVQTKAQLIEKISYYEQILENQKNSSKYSAEGLHQLKEKYRQLKSDYIGLQEYLEKILQKLEYYKGKYRSLRAQVNDQGQSSQSNEKLLKIIEGQKAQYQKLVNEIQSEKDTLQDKVYELEEHKAVLEHEIKRLIEMVKANYVEKRFYKKLRQEKEQVELELLALRTAVNEKIDSVTTYHVNLAKLSELHREDYLDCDGENTSDEYDEITDQTFSQLASFISNNDNKESRRVVQKNENDDNKSSENILKRQDECTNLAQDVQNDIQDLRKIIVSRDEEIKSLKSSLGRLKGRQGLESEARAEIYNKLQGLTKNHEDDEDNNNNK